MLLLLLRKQKRFSFPRFFLQAEAAKERTIKKEVNGMNREYLIKYLNHKHKEYDSVINTRELYT